MGEGGGGGAGAWGEGGGTEGEPVGKKMENNMSEIINTFNNKERLN